MLPYYPSPYAGIHNSQLRFNAAQLAWFLAPQMGVMPSDLESAAWYVADGMDIKVASNHFLGDLPTIQAHWQSVQAAHDVMRAIGAAVAAIFLTNNPNVFIDQCEPSGSIAAPIIGGYNDVTKKWATIRRSILVTTSIAVVHYWEDDQKATHVYSDPQDALSDFRQWINA